MNNQTLSFAAVSARESARQGNGKFDFRVATEADIDRELNAITEGTSSFDKRQAEGERMRQERAEAEARQVVFGQKDGKVLSQDEIKKIANRSGQYWYERYQVGSNTGTHLASPEDLAN